MPSELDAKKSRLEGWLTTILAALFRHAADEPQPDGGKLIEDFDLMVGCRCPCGSKILHRLTLVSTADCPRCGRTIGIRSIVYYRRGLGTLPMPDVSIGWVMTDEKLAARPAAKGVH